MHTAYGNIVTNEPLEVAPVDLSPVDSIEPEHLRSLREMLASVEEKFSPDNLSDEEILDVARSVGQSYIDIYEQDTTLSLAYLGINETSVGELDRSEQANQAEKDSDYNPYEQKRPPQYSSAFKFFYDSIKAELMASGASDEEIGVETQHILDDFATTSSNVANELTGNLARFKFLISGFGNPDVLRAEGLDAASAYIEVLVGSIANMGERPAREKLGKKIGGFISGRRTMTQDEFDNFTMNKIARFKDRTPAELLEEYVKNAMLYYAKAIYGQVPYVASRGRESDPSYMYDSFQAQTMGITTQTRPMTPKDVAVNGVQAKIDDILYKNPKWKTKFDTYYGRSRNDWRSEERRFRERIFNSARFNDKSGAQNANPSSAPESRSPISDFEKRVQQLDPQKRNIMITLSQRLAAIPDRKLDDSFRSMKGPLKDDLLDRLEREEGEIPEFNKYLRVVMSGLHPDINPGDHKKEQLYKFYGYVRSVEAD